MEKQTKRDIQQVVISVLIACVISLIVGMIIFKKDSGVNQTQTVTVDTANSKLHSDKININTATIKELQFLPGIGEDKAKAIIDNRPFTNISQLLNVKGIGSTTYNQIKSEVKIK